MSPPLTKNTVFGILIDGEVSAFKLTHLRDGELLTADMVAQGRKVEIFDYANKKVVKTLSYPRFCLAILREASVMLYGRRQWQVGLSRDLKTPVRTIESWFNVEPFPDLRQKLADLCRWKDPYDPNMERMARKLESLGSPE